MGMGGGDAALRRMEAASGEVLAQTLVALVARLREDRRHQLVLQASVAAEDVSASALPADRLLALFRGILECVLATGAPGVVRGNLYSALIHYLHLVEAEKELAILGLARGGRSKIQV